jgi:hypothetical protein
VPKNVKYHWEITVSFDISKHNAESLKRMAKDKDERNRKRLQSGQFGTKDIIHHFEFESEETCINFKELLSKNDVEYCGDDLTVRVTAMTDDGWYQAKLLGRIVGENPTQTDTNSYLDQAFVKAFDKVRANHADFPLTETDAKILRAILFHNESGARHFLKNGTPLYGYPNGWGIMQIDPPSKEENLWNWIRNMDEAVNRLKGKIE